MFRPGYRDHRDLHSFPTRRSSDLAAGAAGTGPTAGGVCDGRGSSRTGTRGDTGTGEAISTGSGGGVAGRSEEHTSELQSLAYLVCRLLLEKKKKASSGARSAARRA